MSSGAFTKAEMQNSHGAQGADPGATISRTKLSRELHATELQQLREEKTQLQAAACQGAATARAATTPWATNHLQQELQKLEPGWTKPQELQQELEHVKYQKSVVERQKALLESNLTCWQRRSSSFLD